MWKINLKKPVACTTFNNNSNNLFQTIMYCVHVFIELNNNNANASVAATGHSYIVYNREIQS